MIWLALVAVVFVAGGTWFVAKSMQTRVIVLVAGLAAVGAYWMIGKPSMPDEPLETRIGDLETLAKNDPESLRVDQIMALAQKRAQDRPNDPQPHWIMGKMLETTGDVEGATLAYQSALKRDPNDINSLISLADLRFKSAMQVDQATSELYEQAYSLQPDNIRIGYMAGIGLWLQGKKDAAEKTWADVDAKAAKDAPERQMYAALRQMFGIDPAPAAPAGQPAKPPG